MEDWMLDQREAVAARIEQGFAQAERGELIDGDEAVEMLRRRRIERLKPHG
jgi:predicted transcriptional regulator